MNIILTFVLYNLKKLAIMAYLLKNYLKIGHNNMCIAIRNISTSTIRLTAGSDEPVQMDNPFEKEKKKCILCELEITPHYKNVRLLSQFQSPYTGRIYGRHITGLCKHKQEQVEKEIVRAQTAAYMPAYHKALEYLNDPKLFDPERPIRPHKY